MKKLITAGLSALVAGAAPGIVSAEGPLDAENFSANVGFTTDYIWRGETQTNNDPAIQGGFDWGYNGFYLGVWGSNADFGLGSNVEIDYYGGYGGEIGPFGYDLLAIYYTYPGTDDGGDFQCGLGPGVSCEFDYFEFIPKLTYTFETTLEPSIYFQYGYSPDYFFEEGDGSNVEGGLGLSFPNGIGVDGAVGYQWVDGDNSGGDIEWLYYNVGVTASWIGFDFDLRYHRAEEDGIDWLANDDYPDDDHIVFSVSRSF
jgi:uncharacterized protein (TIGR02001 family)